MYPRTIEICISESYSRLVALMLFAALHNRKLFRSSVPLTVYYSESCLVVPRANSGASRFTTQRVASCFLCRELPPVCCAESYLKIRSGVPKATSGLLGREVLPVYCAEIEISAIFLCEAQQIGRWHPAAQCNDDTSNSNCNRALEPRSVVPRDWCAGSYPRTGATTWSVMPSVKLQTHHLYNVMWAVVVGWQLKATSFTRCWRSSSP